MFCRVFMSAQKRIIIGRVKMSSRNCAALHMVSLMEKTHITVMFQVRMFRTMYSAATVRHVIITSRKFNDCPKFTG